MTRSSSGKRVSPNRPIENVVVHTMVIAQMNVAAAVKAGLTRAAIHTNTGQSEKTASLSVQDSSDKTTRSAHTPATIASAKVPSAISLGGGGLRRNDARPITSG